MMRDIIVCGTNLEIFAGREEPYICQSYLITLVAVQGTRVIHSQCPTTGSSVLSINSHWQFC